MDADDLRIVDAVARIGSMNRAATELNMVQSNVTARIRLLEEELGVQLFVRHSRGVVPSEAGLRLLSYVEQIRALFQQAIVAVKEDGTPKGKLRIGILDTTAGLRLPTLIAQYAKEYPRVELSVVTGTTTSLMNEVVEHKLDAAFVAGPIQAPYPYETSMTSPKLRTSKQSCFERGVLTVKDSALSWMG
jgi:LysR family transcriptional regulator, cell division regulator